jgi:hypothetical protein
LIVDDYYLARLNRDDHARELQSLYDRCPDYVQIAFGEPARVSAAEEDFAFQRNMVFGAADEAWRTGARACPPMNPHFFRV